MIGFAPFFQYETPRTTQNLSRFVQIVCLVCAALCNLQNAKAGFGFTPGHIYSTSTFGNTTNVVEHSADGTFLDSLTIPSLLQDDELRGIAFSPDGLLYAVMVHFADSGFQVLALDSAGTVHQTYRMDGIYIFGGGSYGKIAVDQGNIYVGGASALVHFTIGDPNSGVVLYAHDQVEDVKILPTGHLFVAWDYGVDEITSTGTFVRTVVSASGPDFVNIWGIEYNPATNKLFVTQLGAGSMYSLLRVNASTGEIETGTLFNYASDLFLTDSGNLIVGSWTETARIYNQDIIFVGPLGTEPRFFVTQYPTGQPTPTPTPAPDGCYPNFTTAEGRDALSLLTTGAGNTGLGWYSLSLDTTGSFSTGVGAGALALNNADSNTAVGAAALLLNTSGTQNTAVGTDALVFNDTGSANTATGYFALMNNTTGGSNTAIGWEALTASTTGNDNTAIGNQALQNNVTTSDHVALGSMAGSGITTVDNNIDIGSNGQFSDTRTIRIGQVQTRTFIVGIRGVTTGTANAIPVLIDSLGQLGTMSSARRFKHNIKLIDQASEAILALKPVKFQYKSDNTNTPQFGLIAEEVAEVNPDLVVRDESREIYTVRYDAVNAMLLNEFLKEHRKVEELTKDFQAAVAQLTARLDDQAAQIQKVSAELEANKPAPQVVNNP